MKRRTKGAQMQKKQQKFNEDKNNNNPDTNINSFKNDQQSQ
jgi:hypothetical protein